MAHDLVAALKHRGLVFDTGVTTDAVRVLRRSVRSIARPTRSASRGSISKALTALITIPTS